MTTKHLEEGMHVRIAKNLKNSKTRNKYDINSTMEKMEGKVFPIDGRYSPTAILIRPGVGKTRYTFHPDDLEIVTCEIKYPDPEHFDPKNLNT